MFDVNVKKYRKQAVIGFIFLTFLVAGLFYPVIGLVIPGCMIFGIIVGFSKGRKWCDWYCPRGSFYDSILKAVSPKRKIPEFFKNMSLRVGLLSFLITVMILQIIRYWPNPSAIGQVFMVILTSTTIIGIVLGLFIHNRSWCYMCPIGTVANLIGKDKYPLKFNKDNCVNCKLCADACPIQIDPHISLSDDCLKCGNCVNECSKKALEF